MKIALLGYGKMGKTIEQMALQREHEVVLKINDSQQKYNIKQADVAIEFSTPSSAFANISHCIENGIPVVAGTTGWLEHYSEIEALCRERQGAFLYASNFSIGMNLFFKLNKVLAKMMASFNQYQISIEEVHHTQKLDAPSGTAITLAEGIIQNTAKEGWILGQTQTDDNIPIEAKRIGNVPGTHFITYRSPEDTIEIKHIAHNRNGFALGAIIAAEWIVNKKGIFSMDDILNITD